MLKQLQDRELEKLKSQLDVAKRMIHELIGALDCQDPELRALTRDVALFYMSSYLEKNKP